MPKQPDQPPPPLSRVIALGKHWNAIVLVDDSVLLHHQSQVPVCGTEKVYNLRDMHEDQILELQELKELDAERIAVRTVLMSTDGSLLCDPDGISPNGELSDQVFTLLPPTIYACSKYFARRTGRDDW